MRLESKSHIFFPVVCGAVFVVMLAALSVKTRPLDSMLIALGVSALIVFVGYCRFMRSFLVRSEPLEPATDEEKALHQSLGVPLLFFYAALLTSGLLIARPFMGFTLSDWLFYGAFGGTILLQLTSKSTIGHKYPGMLILGVGLFSVGGLLASMGASSPWNSLIETVKAMYLLGVWLWLGAALIRTRTQLYTSVGLWVAGMSLSGIAAWVQLIGLGEFWSSTANNGHFTGGADHPNDLGAQAAIALIPALWLLKLRATSLVARWFRLVPILALTSGIVLSGSVASFAVAGVSLLLWFGATIRMSIKTLVAVGVGTISIIALLNAATELGVNAPMERILATTDADSVNCTSCSRLTSNQLAIEAVLEQPFVGHGLDPAGIRLSDGSRVHNMLLKAWYEAGLPGLIGLVVVVLMITAAGSSAFRYAVSETDRYLLLALLIAFMSFLMIATVQPILYQRYAWFPAMLLLVAANQHSRLVDIRSIIPPKLSSRRDKVRKSSSVRRNSSASRLGVRSTIHPESTIGIG